MRALLTIGIGTLAAAALAGCTSFVPVATTTTTTTVTTPQRPATTQVTPSPTQPVSSTTLPPIPGAPTDLATLTPSTTGGTVPPATGPAPVQISRTDALGAWTLSASGETCRINLTLTSWTGGYRASTTACTSAELQGVSAWDFVDSRVLLKNSAGTTIGTLSATGQARFGGSLTSGRSVTIFR